MRLKSDGLSTLEELDTQGQCQDEERKETIFAAKLSKQPATVHYGSLPHMIAPGECSPSCTQQFGSLGLCKLGLMDIRTAPPAIQKLAMVLGLTRPSQVDIRQMKA